MGQRIVISVCVYATPPRLLRIISFFMGCYSKIRCPITFRTIDVCPDISIGEAMSEPA